MAKSIEMAEKPEKYKIQLTQIRYLSQTNPSHMNTQLKHNLAYLMPILLFFILSLAYFTPGVLEGKKLNMHDIVQFKGMSKEIADHREKFDEEPLWTNSMFGGMPAYLVSTQYNGNLLKKLHRAFTLIDFRPIGFVFLYLTGAYIALLLFGLPPWLSFAGAIAYAFSSYLFIIIDAGHISKVFALGYMPPIVAGVYASFRGRTIAGSLIAGLFLGIQMLVNHLQITYYTMLVVLVFVIYELIHSIRNKAFLSFLKPAPWLLLAVTLAVGSNLSNLLTTYEYGKYSIRGKSELTGNAENKTSGLDRDYATQWSYGIGETFTLLIPNFRGGSSTGSLKQSSETYRYIKNNYGAGEARKFISQVPLYWGKQPGTSGPVYVGAVVVFLFILGLFIVKGPVKWWLLTVTVVSILLAWGHNFEGLTNFMLDHFPGYNKFRTVSMTLVMAGLAMPLLAILAMKTVMESGIEKKLFLRYWQYSVFGITGLLLLILLVAGSFDVSAPVDAQLIAQGLEPIVDSIRQDRISLLRSDAFRSLVFVALTALLVYFLYQKKLKAQTTVWLLALLLLADLWPVNKRYLNQDDFVTKKEDNNPFTPSTADLIILRDKDPNYRVINLSLSVLQDASTSYFHKSIGGYHGAKMRRFQELFDNRIEQEITALINTMQKRMTPEAVDSTLATLNALNMLNTRYIIYNPEAPPLVNNHELGNAWFVDSLAFVPDADAEIAAVQAFHPSHTAIIHRQFAPFVEGLELKKDTNSLISLVEYRANYLKYTCQSPVENLAVFSEVYYDKGWTAYIDGKQAPHFRVNYLLRAMRVPAGNHAIEFRFHPKSYYLGEKVSFASSLVLILLLIGTGYFEWQKKKKT